MPHFGGAFLKIIMIMEVLGNKTLAQIEAGEPGKRIITLRSVYKTGTYKGSGLVWVQPKAHPTNYNQYLGITPLSEMDKQKVPYHADENSLMELKDGITFDLDNPIDECNWNWVKHTDPVECTKEDAHRKPHAQFYIEQESFEAKAAVADATTKVEAMQYVIKDSIDSLYVHAAILGSNMDNQPSTEVRAFLLKMAETQPSKVVNVYTDKEVKMKAFIHRAVKAGVITVDAPTGFYIYGNSTIGTTLQSAVTFLKDKANADLAESLHEEVTRLTSNK